MQYFRTTFLMFNFFKYSEAYQVMFCCDIIFNWYVHIPTSWKCSGQDGQDLSMTDVGRRSLTIRTNVRRACFTKISFSSHNGCWRRMKPLMNLQKRAPVRFQKFITANLYNLLMIKAAFLLFIKSFFAQYIFQVADILVTGENEEHTVVSTALSVFL